MNNCMKNSLERPENSPELEIVESVSSDDVCWDDPDLAPPDPVESEPQTKASYENLLDAETQSDLFYSIVSNSDVARQVAEITDPKCFSNKYQQLICEIVLNHVKQYEMSPTFEQIKTYFNRYATGKPTILENKLRYLTEAKYALDFRINWECSDYYVKSLRELAARKSLTEGMTKLWDDVKSGKSMGDIMEKHKAIFEKPTSIVDDDDDWEFQTYEEMKIEAENQKDDFLIENWLEFQTIGMLTGFPFSGKSCIITKIITSICDTGTFGGRPCNQNCGILLMDRENKGKVTVRRIKAECNGEDGKIKFIKANLKVKEGKLSPRQIEKCIKRAKIKMGCEKIFVVVDTMRSILGIDELETQSVTECLYPLQQAAQRQDAAILVVHHRPKTGASYSGSTAVAGALDYLWLWQSDPVTKIATLSLEGERSGGEEKPMRFQFMQGQNVFLPDGQTEGEKDIMLEAVEKSLNGKCLYQKDLIPLIQHYHKEYPEVKCPGINRIREIIKSYLDQGILYTNSDGMIGRVANLMLVSLDD